MKQELHESRMNGKRLVRVEAPGRQPVLLRYHAFPCTGDWVSVYSELFVVRDRKFVCPLHGESFARLVCEPLLEDQHATVRRHAASAGESR